MRLALVVPLLLLAGCLEPGGDDLTTTPTAGTPTPPAAGTPTPKATPTATPTATPAAGAEPVPFRTLAFGQQAGIRDEERVVLTTQAEYEAFWARVREDPAEPAPAVDLEAETVVGVVAGARPNLCWTIRVTNATADGAGATSAEVTTYEPPPDVMCAQAVAYPWHLVALEGAQREVTFVETTRAGPPDE